MPLGGYAVEKEEFLNEIPIVFSFLIASHPGESLC